MARLRRATGVAAFWKVGSFRGSKLPRRSSRSVNGRGMLQDKACEESQAGRFHSGEGVRDTLVLPGCLLQFGDKYLLFP